MLGFHRKDYDLGRHVVKKCAFLSVARSSDFAPPPAIAYCVDLFGILNLLAALLLPGAGSL